MDISQELRYEATGEYGVMPPVRYIPLMLSAANEIDDLNHRLDQTEQHYIELAVERLAALEEERRLGDELADALTLLHEARGIPTHLIDIIFDVLDKYDQKRHNNG